LRLGLHGCAGRAAILEYDAGLDRAEAEEAAAAEELGAELPAFLDRRKAKA